MKKKTEKQFCVQLFAAFVSHSAHFSLIASFEDNFCTFVALLPHFRCTFWGDDHRNRWPFIQHTCVLSNCKVEVATKRESEILWASEFGRNDDVDQFWSRRLAELCWRCFLSFVCLQLPYWLVAASTRNWFLKSHVLHSVAQSQEMLKYRRLGLGCLVSKWSRLIRACQSGRTLLHV